MLFFLLEDGDNTYLLLLCLLNFSFVQKKKIVVNSVWIFPIDFPLFWMDKSMKTRILGITTLTEILNFINSQTGTQI